MKEWYSSGELAGLPGMPASPRNVRIVAMRHGWRTAERDGRGGGTIFHVASLPAATQVALATRHEEPSDGEGFDREAAWRGLDAKPGRLRELGMERAQILVEVQRARAAGFSKREAVKLIADQHGVTERTLWRWARDVRGLDSHDWAAVLAPVGYGTQKSAEASCDPELWDVFVCDYMRHQGPAASACYERVRRIADAEGLTLPSYKTMLRRVERQFPPQCIVLRRQGSDALARLYPPQVRDRSGLRALEVVNADGHIFDVFVRWPDGEVRRPMMLAWQDIYSGKLLSYRIDFKENSHAVRLSFGDVVTRFGIPLHAYLDNGRAFASKWITGGVPNRYRFTVREGEPLGLLSALGVEVHWATPYHGQSKPIERAFRDFCEYVSKHPAFKGAYTGNKPTAKPEDYGTRAVPLADFLRVLEQEVRAHNARTGRRSEVCAGRSSFDVAFAESYAKGPVRKATVEQQRLWLLTAEQVIANRETGAIKLFDNVYHCDALVAYRGQPLVVRFDPDRLHNPIHVYTADEAYIGAAACEEAVGFMNTEAASDLAKARRRRNRAAREYAEANIRLEAADVAARLPEIPEPPQPETNLVQLANPKLAAKPARRIEAVIDDPEQTARGERVIADLDERRRLQLEDESDADRQWARYCELRASAQVGPGEEAWMRSFETTPLYHSRRDLEELFEKKTPVGEATGA